MLREVFLFTCTFGRNAASGTEVSLSHSFCERDRTGSWNLTLGSKCWMYPAIASALFRCELYMLLLKSVVIWCKISIAPLLWPIGDIHTPRVLYDSAVSILLITSAALVLLPEVMRRSCRGHGVRKLMYGMWLVHYFIAKKEETRNIFVSLGSPLYYIGAAPILG
jgi:hypothetical protein